MMRIFSPAKLNLSLSIGAALDDGFHDVDTVIQTVSFGDTVTIEPGAAIHIRCTNPSVPTDESNLCFRAAEVFNKYAEHTGGVLIAIEKNIPIGSGLGGGASNAAAVLKGLNKLNGALLSQEKLIKCAALVGSDVPSFILGGTIHGAHHGEHVSPLPPIPLCWFVIVDTGVAVNTKDAYGWWDEASLNMKQIPVPYEASLKWLTDHAANDFMAVISKRFPAILENIKALERLGAARARLTGSGGCVFGIFTDEASARRSARAFQKAYLATPYSH